MFAAEAPSPPQNLYAIRETKVKHLVGTGVIAHDQSIKIKSIPSNRQTSIAGCMGSSGMAGALSNPHSNMNKDMIRSKNVNPPSVVFDSVKKPKETWKNKAQVSWVQPKNQRLTLQ